MRFYIIKYNIFKKKIKDKSNQIKYHFFFLHILNKQEKQLFFLF